MLQKQLCVELLCLHRNSNVYTLKNKSRDCFQASFLGSFFSTKCISPCLWIGLLSSYLLCHFSKTISQWLWLLPGTCPLKLCHMLTCLMCWILFYFDPVSKHFCIEKHPSSISCVVLCWLNMFFTCVNLQFSQNACLRINSLLRIFRVGENHFVLRHGAVLNGFIIHFSNLLQEYYPSMNINGIKNSHISQLNANENAILEGICITER